MSYINKSELILLGLALLLIAVLAGIYFLNQMFMQPAPSVSIDAEYEGKIVYTTSTGQDEAPFVRDCSARGGTFNACGTTCAPDAAVCTSVCAYTCKLPTQAPDNEPAWRTFENDTYGFSFSYPPDWRIAAYPNDPIAPKFNVYPPSVSAMAPFIHHDAVAHVSVYPEGIPTEGLFGQRASTTVSFDMPILQAVDYVVESGEPFATFATPANPPSSWNEAGFLFSRTPIENGETVCLRGGEPVAEDQCDPLFGDEIRHRGTVDQSLRATQVRILESISFE